MLGSQGAHHLVLRIQRVPGSSRFYKAVTVCGREMKVLPVDYEPLGADISRFSRCQTCDRTLSDANITMAFLQNRLIMRMVSVGKISKGTRADWDHAEALVKQVQGQRDHRPVAGIYGDGMSELLF